MKNAMMKKRYSCPRLAVIEIRQEKAIAASDPIVSIVPNETGNPSSADSRLFNFGGASHDGDPTKTILDDFLY
jgi:hypothetical protein